MSILFALGDRDGYIQTKSTGTQEIGMSEFEPGSMDTTEQVKTFNGFIKMTTWVSVIIIAILVFLAIVGT